MCFKESKPKFSEKELIMVPRDPDIVVYFREVGKKDPQHFRVAEYEDAFVICPKGEIKYVGSPGFYKLVSIPAKIIWVRSAKFLLTVGVPVGILPGGFGVHADLILLIKNPDSIVRSIVSSSTEGRITISEVKMELRRLLENAVRNLQITPNMDRREVVESLHREMNSLLMRSWLNGFLIDVQSVGFSFECEISKILSELVR